MVGTFSENKSGFVIVNEVEHGGNDTATLRSFRPLLKIFVWPVPLSRGDAVPVDILSCRGSVLLHSINHDDTSHKRGKILAFLMLMQGSE